MSARPPRLAACGRPSGGNRRCPSPFTAATTSTHLQRSHRRPPQPRARIGPTKPPQQHALEDHQNRLVPSLLASCPARSLNHKHARLGIHNRLSLIRIDSRPPELAICRIQSGGERAAAIYTVIETTKLNCFELQAYIADVIARITGGWPASRWHKLMPWNWQAQQDKDKLAA